MSEAERGRRRSHGRVCSESVGYVSPHCFPASSVFSARMKLLSVFQMVWFI